MQNNQNCDNLTCQSDAVVRRDAACDVFSEDNFDIIHGLRTKWSVETSLLEGIQLGIIQKSIVVRITDLYTTYSLCSQNYVVNIRIVKFTQGVHRVLPQIEQIDRIDRTFEQI